MKSFYRHLILILIITLLPGFQAWSANEEKIPLNTREYNILKAINVIAENMPAIYSGDIFTRAQFASLTAGLLNIDNTNKGYDSEFIDVNTNYWCSHQIYALREIGVINGVNSYQFLPEEGITLAHAAKILVSVLGYDLKAAGKYGGTSEGYVMMANELQLIPQKSYGSNDLLKTEDALNMIYRATKADIMEQTVFGNEPSYDVIKKNNLLAKYKKIYLQNGIMTDNGITAINGNSSIPYSQIKVGQTIIFKNGINSSDFIGFYVECYYRNEDNTTENYLMYIGEVQNRNEKFVISSEDLKIDDPAFSTTSIVYEKNDKTLSVSVDPLADVIYNGKAYPAFNKETLKIKSGSLTLVNTNNTTNRYNLIIINEYKNIFVSAVDIYSETIYGKYGNTIKLKDYERTYLFDVNKKDIVLDDIKPEFVVSYLESKDKNTITIISISNKISDTLNEVSEDPNIYKSLYYMKEKPYKLSHSFIEAYRNNILNLKLPESGGSYSFYMDIENKIAAVTVTANTGTQYAYLLDANTSKKLEYADTVLIRLFMPNGEIFDAYTAKKIKINDSDRTDCKNLLPYIQENGKTKRQIVKIKLNSDGDIIEFDYAVTGTSDYGYDPDRFTLDFASTSVQYKGGNQRCFNGSYSINDASVLFMVPVDEDYDIEDIQIITSAQLTDGKYYNVTIYDSDATLAASAMVVRGSELFEQAIFLVDKVSTGINSEGDPVKKLSGIYGGNYVSMLEKNPGSLPAGLKTGDVGRFTIYSNEISEFELLASLSDNPPPFIKPLEGAFVGGAFITIWAPLYARSTNAISTLIPFSGSSTKITAHSLNGAGAKVAVYDVKNQKIRAGTYSDLTTSSIIDSNGDLILNSDSTMVFIYRRMDYVREIIVVKY